MKQPVAQLRPILKASDHQVAMQKSSKLWRVQQILSALLVVMGAIMIAFGSFGSRINTQVRGWGGVTVMLGLLWLMVALVCARRFDE
jgi:protein-S-isoprenylcysteine O-methyltransferase Ste14